MSRPGWWRRRSLRARLILIGVVGLCLGFLVGGLVLVAALGFVLQRSVDTQARRTAQDVAVLVNQSALPEPVPLVGSDLVQVVDAAGRVRSASMGADRLVPMLRPEQVARVRSGQALFVDGGPLGLAGPVRVVGVPAGPPGDPQTVVVARSMADVVRGAQLLRGLLLVVFPLLVLALAMVAWRVVGATLRPVEALRRGAEEITGTGRPGRLPVPAGQDEIQSLAVTLNGMLDRLEAGRTRQREFVADAAHELRSPLANMRTQLEVAQRIGGAADWPGVAEDLLTDTRRLARLVDDLLLLARSDESTGLARPEPVELGSLVDEVGSRYHEATVSIPDSPYWVSGDPGALRRVFANLLDNAVRHARSRVAVAVSAESAGQWCTVTVTDDGPGIPEADRNRVFERFTRLDDARTRDGGGAGLGLAIVGDLVRQHGGTVTLADATHQAGQRQPEGPPHARPAGPGLQVTVRLPAYPDAVGRLG